MTNEKNGRIYEKYYLDNCFVLLLGQVFYVTTVLYEYMYVVP